MEKPARLNSRLRGKIALPSSRWYIQSIPPEVQVLGPFPKSLSEFCGQPLTQASAQEVCAMRPPRLTLAAAMPLRSRHLQAQLATVVLSHAMAV
eukprot:4785079-Amphidinium_carterae.1